MDYKLLATDGTKIKASASSDFTGTIKDFKNKLKKLEEKIENLLAKQLEADSVEEREENERKKKKYESELKKLSDFLKSSQKIVNTNGREGKQNIIDKDYKIMKVNGAFTEALNAQAVSDSKHGLVVAAEVTGEVNDYGNFDLMIDEVKQNASKAGEVDLKETKYVFDSGYYSVENIVKADKDELDVYIADSKDKNIYEDIELTKPNGKISSRECTIVKKEEQIYLRCPGEIEIPLSGKKRNRQCDNYVFKIKDKEKCKGCKYYENCLEGVKIKTFVVKKTRVDNIEKLIEHSKKLRSKEGRKIYSRRMPTIEKTFAVTKEIFNFRRTYRRGKDKISTEWDLICSVYNLRRMFTLLNA